MAEFTEGDLPINGINIHYYRMGSLRKPPVVLLHGFSDGGRSWVRLARDLANDFDLIMLDAAGHGQSGGIEHGFRERAVGDVLAAIEQLGLERPAIVGHSMGAGTTSGVATEASERLRGVVLEDPAWFDGERPTLGADPNATGSRAPLRSPAWAEWMRSLKSHSPAELAAAAEAERPEWDPADRAYWAESKAGFDLNIVARPFDFGTTPWRETAAKITCPALLIYADPARGGIVTPEVAAEATTILPQGQAVQIPDAGHNIRKDNYPPFRDAVAAFLREITPA
jgi:pimeloyl-ACP methyl ester carboxylesterase